MALSNEQIFLFTLQDIREKLIKGDDYSLLRVCGLLRHLVSEPGCLFELVNAHYKIRPICNVVDWQGLNSIKLRVNWCNPLPEKNKNQKTVSLTLNQFKNYNILIVKGHKFKVDEVITGVSHFMGGIHSGAPKDNKESALAELYKIVYDRKAKITFYTIHAIAKVILRSLEELESMVIRHTSNIGF